MRRTTSLNPLLVLIAVLLGAQLLGIFGALIAIPVGSMIKILVQDWWAHRPPRSPEQAGTPSPPPPEPAGTDVRHLTGRHRPRSSTTTC